MNEVEKQMILDLSLDEISQEEFYDKYPVKLLDNQSYFVNILEEALLKKNSEDVEFVLMIAGYIDSIKVYLPVLRKLILENWHNQHEIIVDILSGVLDKSDAKYFYHVLKSEYDYIEDVEDFLVPIWIKCLWALYKIGSEKAFDYLKQFQDSEYEDIKNTATELLSRIK